MKTIKEKVAIWSYDFGQYAKENGIRVPATDEYLMRLLSCYPEMKSQIMQNYKRGYNAQTQLNFHVVSIVMADASEKKFEVFAETSDAAYRMVAKKFANVEGYIF